LYGIDAPELGQTCKRNDSPYDCSAVPKEYLEFILTEAKVGCTKKSKDKWGRFIGVCSVDGDDISQLIVRHGWALAYKLYSPAYVQDEEFVQSNKLEM
jgi:endonuclease YncB( thermonuclease family)